MTRWKAFAAATSTLCAAFGLPATLICACLPIQAAVWLVTTFTDPDTPTLTEPDREALMPTPAMSSLLVAVTATPRKPACGTWLTECWPSASAASPPGRLPCLTRLCERFLTPLTVALLGVRGMMWPASASSLLTARPKYEPSL